MAEVRVDVDAEYLEQLKKKLGITKNVDLIKEALAVLNWSADELGQGRQVLSSDAEFKQMTRLVTPNLAKAARGRSDENG